MCRFKTGPRHIKLQIESLWSIGSLCPTTEQRLISQHIGLNNAWTTSDQLLNRVWIKSKQHLITTLDFWTIPEQCLITNLTSEQRLTSNEGVCSLTLMPSLAWGKNTSHVWAHITNQVLGMRNTDDSDPLGYLFVVCSPTDTSLGLRAIQNILYVFLYFWAPPKCMIFTNGVVMLLDRN